jgi:hypothetical protein
MSRKDYRLIAAAIREARGISYRLVDQITIDIVAGSIAEKLGEDNSAFDRAKFLNACEIGG